MTIQLNAGHVRLAQSLPPKLLRFFARHPPSSSTGAATQSLATTTSLNTSASDASVELIKNTLEDASPAIPHNNPFRWMKHPMTGVWHEPKYSMRRQADLVKLARQYGVEELLPPTSKGTQAKLEKREEHGLRVKGTGVGQNVKGHWRERTLKGRLEKRREAMLNMPKLVREWQQKGHGRYWRKFPK